MCQNVEIHKFRIILRAFNSKKLNESCIKICEAVNDKQDKCKLVGPIALPTKIKRFCVLRSPHVDKDSREHFEIKYLKRIIDIHTNSAVVLDSLMRISLPSGVSVSIQRTSSPYLSFND